MLDGTVDEHLVGYAQGLLQNGLRVWIGRANVDRLSRITNIYIADDTSLVIAELPESESRIFIAPGQLAVVLSGAAEALPESAG